MAHDVFISYSSRDKAVADSMCATLESRKIRCWIAPRDVPPGQPWPVALVEAIGKSRVFVLILSNGSNNSPQVLREVGEAMDKGIPAIPFRIDDVKPSKEMGYYIRGIHWLDAMTPPLEKHLQSLADTVQRLLGVEGTERPPVGTPSVESVEAAARMKPAPRPIQQTWAPLLILLALVCSILVLGGVGISLVKGGILKLPAWFPNGLSSPGPTKVPTETLPAIPPDANIVAPTFSILPEASESQPHPVLSIGPDSQIHLAWTGPGSGDWNNYYARSTDGGTTFSQPILVDAEAGSILREHPALAVGLDGRVYIAWEDKYNGNWDVYYAYSADGTTFSPAVRVNDDTTLSDQMRPTLAVGRDSTVYLAWQDQRNGDWDIYSARLADNDNTFGLNAQVNVETRGQQVDPAIGVDSQGQVHMVWADDQSGKWMIYYARSEGEGFRQGRVVGSGLMQDLSNELPSLTIGPDDKVHVTWASAYILHNVYNVPLYLPVYAVSANRGDTFSSPRQAGNGYQYVSVRPNETTIAVDGMTVHVILTTYSPRDGSLIWDYCSMDGGLNFKDPVSVAQAQGGDVMHYPMAVIDQTGHLHVLWAYARGDEWDIYYARSTDGGNNFSEGVKVSGEK